MFLASKGEEMELFSNTPTPAPAASPKKAAAAKPKAASKPRWRISIHGREQLVEALVEVAAQLEPTATYTERLRVAADLYDMIEKAKA
jgi:hypothetical protein